MSRQALALLPGLLCDRALWQAQIDALGDLADCRVADFTSQDRLSAMAESVLASMPERFALAGLSMGGYVAFEVMRRAPERVTRLAPLDTSARPDTPAQTAHRRDLIELARRGTFKGVTARLLPLFVHEARLDEPDLSEAVSAMTLRVGREVFLRQQAAIMGRTDSRPTLVSVRCPTVVICGRQDRLTPLECHIEMAAGIAEARLVVIEAAGHLPTMERPDEVNAALRSWLTR